LLRASSKRKQLSFWYYLAAGDRRPCSTGRLWRGRPLSRRPGRPRGPRRCRI